jgi:hypothetical protein
VWRRCASIWQADGERFLCWAPIDNMGTIYQEMCGGAGVKDGIVLVPRGGRLGVCEWEGVVVCVGRFH